VDYLEREREKQRCSVEKSFVKESKSYGSMGGELVFVGTSSHLGNS
jgi:hypothetical protein